ncbi:FadR/GntR family transcriptional regulator [Streptomyces sp. NPDC001978]|uniref:FadR/GntR family transcriptional regulator n=1 Tax=Streptomyces sp. NPDC001978 TaxID=3364627 RepID=UPI0036AE2183
MGSEADRTAHAAGQAAPPEGYRPGYEVAAERLLEYIVERRLKPGDRLPTERGLAEILGVGRTVTREAVKVLAAVGRVSVRRGAGIFVAAPQALSAESEVAYYRPTDLEQVRMLFDYRRLIEAETSRRAAEFATPSQVRAIRAAAQETLEKATDPDPRVFARCDRAFHDAVAAAAGNVFLEAGVAQLRDFAQQSDLLLFGAELPGSLETAAHQHLAIAGAIADGEPGIAAKAMVEHIDTTQDQFECKIRERLLSPPRQEGRP